MKHGSLFSGVGGFDLAVAWTGWENIFHCEKDSFCKEILKFYWPGGDSYGDIGKFNATKYRGTIDVLSAGFPCQPFSKAGQRKGQKDDRYLWPQALRIIKEVGPRWVVLENVAGIFTILEPECLSEMEIQTIELFNQDHFQESKNTILRIERRVIGTIIKEIESAGFKLPSLSDGTPVVLCIPACAVNAPHRRDRIWIVAYSDIEGLEGWEKAGDVKTKETQTNQHFIGLFDSNNWDNRPRESPFCSRDDGVSARLDSITFSKYRNESLKAYGNSVVPQVAFQIFQAIERSENDDIRSL